MPDPGDARVAELAVIAFQVIGRDEIALAFDQQLFAVVAVGVITVVAGHIADVDVSNPLLQGQFAITGQGGDRGGRQAVQFVAREESYKMQGVIGADIFQYPVAHGLDHLLLIGVTRHHEIDQFKVNILFVQGPESVQHRFQAAAVQFTVNIVIV